MLANLWYQLLLNFVKLGLTTGAMPVIHLVWSICFSFIIWAYTEVIVSDSGAGCTERNLIPLLKTWLCFSATDSSHNAQNSGA